MLPPPAEDGNLSNLEISNGHPSGGFRYLIARIFHLRAGINVAFSEEGGAFYIVMGNGWNP